MVIGLVSIAVLVTEDRQKIQMFHTFVMYSLLSYPYPCGSET